MLLNDSSGTSSLKKGASLTIQEMWKGKRTFNGLLNKRNKLPVPLSIQDSTAFWKPVN